MKPPGTKRLKAKIDILLSTSAFKFNLRRYTADQQRQHQQSVQGEQAELAASAVFTLLDQLTAWSEDKARVTYGGGGGAGGRGLHSSTFQLNLSRF
jgi:hypothetical protein